jgi:hypothetical protein
VLDGSVGKAAAVVRDAKDDAVMARLERDPDPARLRVAGDVGQALLRDAVDGQLDLRRELRDRGGEVALDAGAGDAGERARQLGQRADQSQVLEHLGPELARDPPHLV